MSKIGSDNKKILRDLLRNYYSLENSMDSAHAMSAPKAPNTPNDRPKYESLTYRLSNEWRSQIEASKSPEPQRAKAPAKEAQVTPKAEKPKWVWRFWSLLIT